jgi:hypothetical protein
VEINGEMIRADAQATSGGPATTTLKFMCDATANNLGMGLIDANGNLTGSNLANSTLYYAYISNNQATLPTQLRMSATAPTWNTDGVQYLGTSGNAANWRYVGMVRSSAAGAFVANSDTQIFIANYYNRKRYRLYVNPGYSDNSAVTTYTTASTTWVAANAGVGAKVEFLTHGDQAVTVGIQGIVEGTGGIFGRLGVGLDSTTQALRLAIKSPGLTLSTDFSLAGTLNFPVSDLTSGYHHLNLLMATTGGTLTILADEGRSGGNPNDTPATLMWADIWA